MAQRALLARIERIEAKLKTKARFAPGCICFPQDGPNFFHWPVEQEIAAQVKCPLHGERFTPPYLVYVSQWFRKKREWFILNRTSEQFQKAWYASFPPDLWPAVEERVGNKIYLRLKDDTKLLAMELRWKRRAVAGGND